MINITSSGIENGYIADRFGKFGEQKMEGVPTRSLPIQWSNLPEGTKSIALVMQDYDAIPVCGFSWIHWLVVDIDPARTGLEEDASRTDSSLIQGKNSLASKQVCGDQPDHITQYYGGPRPPDKDHEYEVRVYALDTKLGLASGFRMNELLQAMRGHILDEGVLHGIYKANEE